jgi:hypothetical protein
MKTLFLIILIFNVGGLFALEKDISPMYRKVYDSVDVSLPKDSAVFYFDLQDLESTARAQTLIYAVDGQENLTYDYSQGDTLMVYSTPGDHTFQFYAGSAYVESPIMHLSIEKQHRQMYRLNLFRTVHPESIQVRKPVLYFYPQDTISLDVHVRPKGVFTFSYPPIEQGWKFQCTPSGQLIKENTSYRYLFWESEQTVDKSFFDSRKGMVCSGSEAVAHLENVLQKFGMNAAERADFMIYWGPILKPKTNLYIYLLFNDMCDAFATLRISPEPDRVARFYILWCEVPETYTPYLQPQDIPKYDREGYTVLEWGGAEFETNLLLKEL